MTAAQFTQTSPADTCIDMLTNMAATVFKHQLVSLLLHWLLSAAKHELAFQSITACSSAGLWHTACMPDLTVTAQGGSEQSPC